METKAMILCNIPTLPILRTVVYCAYLISLSYYKEYPNTPSPLSFAKYRREQQDKGYEDILTIDQLLITKEGDCEDLANSFAAYETANGRNAVPLIVVLENEEQRRTIHVIVLYENGQEFDISLALGMPNEPNIKRII